MKSSIINENCPDMPDKKVVPERAILTSKKLEQQPKSHEGNLEGFDAPMPKADKYSEERMSEALPDRSVAAGVVDTSVLPG